MAEPASDELIAEIEDFQQWRLISLGSVSENGQNILALIARIREQDDTIKRMDDALGRMLGGKCHECNGWGEVAHMGSMVRCKCNGRFVYQPTEADRAAARAARKEPT